MKRFTQKFFLLAIGMILSVGASAQDDGIRHRFPAVQFLYGDKTYIVPAWDVMFGSGDDVTLTRVQAKESYEYNQDQRVKAKIVSRFGITEDADFFTSFGGQVASTIQIAKTDANGNVVKDEEGNPVYLEGSFTVGTVTYSQACPDYSFSGSDGNNSLFYVIGTKPTGDYTITTEKVYKGVTFEIDEIDAWAYRGQRSSGWATPSISSSKVIIPKEITKIGKGAFSYIPTKEVEFEEGSEIDVLSPAAFMNSNLEKITLPASLREIRGAALGGLPNLKNIVFKGTTVPAFETDKFEANSETPATCDPFTAIPRLSKSNVTPAKCIIEVPLGSVGSYAEVQYANNKPLTNFALSSKITLGATGKMTYCSEEDFTVMQYNTAYTSNNDKWEDGALKAYYVKDSPADVDTEGGKVYLTQIEGKTMVPGWSSTDDFGVFLRGEANESYSIFYPYGKMSDKLTMSGTKNCLKGVITPTPITIDPEGDISYFIFSKSTGIFRRITSSGTCQANKAYIMIKDGGYDPSLGTEESKELTISFPEETGIATLETKSVQNDAWYTLQGVLVNQPQKGVFIKNGKKFVIK